MKKFALILMILIGLIMGPGYYIESRYMAGTVTQREVVYGVSTSGGSQPFGWHSPVMVKLEPAMNPIAFDFDMDVTPTPERGEVANDYEVTLSKGATQVWQDHYTFGTAHGIARTYTMRVFHTNTDDRDSRFKMFNIAEAGDYSVNVKPVRADLDARRMELDVVRNASQTEPGVIIVGILLLATGGVLYFRMMMHSD